ncbi:SsgA family sporulation/cell division regulator [Streptomyces sp. NPDC058914]|uniref:SsgA family sporulation/cell division regulator n=1 Tax=Streptomyces TaxID=1883 RepID=UPI0036BB3C71
MAGLPEISEVICTVRMRLVVSHTCTQPMSGEFRYRSEDPYAVEAQFRTGGEEKVRWVFARETLIAGLRTTAGAGDVKIWPSRTGGEDVVVIALESPEGNALLEAPREALQTFLRRTSSVVPPGQEWRYIDVDELLHVAAPRAEGRRRSRTDGV